MLRLVNNKAQSNTVRLIEDKHFYEIPKELKFGDRFKETECFMLLTDEKDLRVGCNSSELTLIAHFYTDYVSVDKTQDSFIFESYREDTLGCILTYDYNKYTLKLETQGSTSCSNFSMKFNRRFHKKAMTFFEQYYLFAKYGYSRYKMSIRNSKLGMGCLYVTRIGDTVNFEGITMQGERINTSVNSKDWVNGSIWHNKNCHVCLERGMERLNITIGTARYYFPIVDVNANDGPYKKILALLMDSLEYAKLDKLQDSNFEPCFREIVLEQQKPMLYETKKNNIIEFKPIQRIED